MSTELFRRVMARDYGDTETHELMARVWAGTPWMIDAFVGFHDSERRMEVMRWCRDNFGPEASPIHEKAGQWHSGNAVINGWMWVGFSTEDQMRKFEARWPAPPEAA